VELQESRKKKNPDLGLARNFLASAKPRFGLSQSSRSSSVASYRRGESLGTPRWPSVGLPSVQNSGKSQLSTPLILFGMSRNLNIARMVLPAPRFTFLRPFFVDIVKSTLRALI